MKLMDIAKKEGIVAKIWGKQLVVAPMLAKEDIKILRKVQRMTQDHVDLQCSMTIMELEGIFGP